MVLVHNVHESGQGAVEVLVEESSAVSQATEAFSAGAFAIATIYHATVGSNSVGTEGVGGVGEEYYAVGGRFQHGGSASFEEAGGGNRGSYGCVGGGAAGGGGGYGCAYGGAGQGWGEGSWFGGEGSWDGHGCTSGGEAEVGVDGQGRHGRPAIGGAGWGGASWRPIDREGGYAASEQSEEASPDAGDWCGDLLRENYDVIGQQQQLVLAPAEDAIGDDASGGVERLNGPKDDEAGPARDPANDAAVQAMLARQCVDTPGFYDRMAESTSAEQQPGDSDSLMSSDDEQGGLGLGSLSGFSLRRNQAGHCLPVRTSRVMTALDVMQQEQQQQACPSADNTSTTKESSRIDGWSADGNGQGTDAVGKVSTGGRADETVPRAFFGEVCTKQLEGAMPSTQTPTAGLESEPAPYLSLDGIEEPKAEPTFEHAFEFPFLYGSQAGGDSREGNVTPSAFPRVSATVSVEDAAGLSMWNDMAPLGFGHGGVGDVTGDHAGGGNASIDGISHSAVGFDDDEEEQDEQVDQAALVLAADSLLGYDAPADGGTPGNDALVRGDADDDDREEEEEEEADEAALALAVDSLLRYDTPARYVEVPPAKRAGAATADLPSSNAATATSGAAAGNNDGHLWGSRDCDEASANGRDGDAATAAVGGVSPALGHRRFHRFTRSITRESSILGEQKQQSDGDKDDVSSSDRRTDGREARAGDDAAAAAAARPASLADEDLADGPMSSGGGGGAWLANAINGGDGGGRIGDGGGSNGATAGGGQKVPGGCGGGTLEPFADGQRTAESFAKIILTTDATGRDQQLTIQPRLTEFEKKEDLSGSRLRTNGDGNGVGGDILNELLWFRGTRDEPGRHEGWSQGVVGRSSGRGHGHRCSYALDNDDDNAADFDGDNGNHEDEDEDVHSAGAVADEVNRREVEGISVGPAVSAEPASDGDVDLRPQFGIVNVAGMAGAAVAMAGEMMGHFAGRTGAVGSPESPMLAGACLSTESQEGDEEGGGTSEEATQRAGSATEGGGRGTGASGDDAGSTYFQGMQPSAPAISAVVGSPYVGGVVDRVHDGERDAVDSVPKTSSPPGTSWLDRVAAYPAVGLLRRWLTCSNADAENLASSHPSIVNGHDTDEGGLASTSFTRREKRLGAGWRSHPTATAFNGDFNARVEDWRVREGHRRSRCAFGSAL